MNLLNTKDYSFQKNRILKAFPTTLINDVETVLDIIPFSENKVKLYDGKYHNLSELIYPSTFNATIDGELLLIPSRVYFNEPNADQEDELSEVQKVILNCIYLLHHNGYLRQRRLEKLIEKNEYWITPFIINLFGEYVFEILEVLNKIINVKTVSNYKQYIVENPRNWQLSSNRMISYWNEHHRRKFPRLKDYIGIRIKKRIQSVA